jgi:hypothetical protein
MTAEEKGAFMRRFPSFWIIVPVIVVLGGALLGGRPATAQTTTTTNSTETHKTITVNIMPFVYHTYQTRITAHLGANPYAYDQSFSVPFSDPLVQAAIATATSTLQGAGAAAIQGPTLLSSQTSHFFTSTYSDVINRSDRIVSTNTFVGPLCIGIGNRDIGPSVPCPPAACGTFPSASSSPCFGTPFPIAPGDADLDTLTHIELYVTRWVTETDTFLTEEHFDLAGEQGAAPVPAFGAGGRTALGGLLVAAALIALRARA